MISHLKGPLTCPETLNCAVAAPVLAARTHALPRTTVSIRIISPHGRSWRRSNSAKKRRIWRRTSLWTLNKRHVSNTNVSVVSAVISNVFANPSSLLSKVLPPATTPTLRFRFFFFFLHLYIVNIHCVLYIIVILLSN